MNMDRNSIIHTKQGSRDRPPSCGSPVSGRPGKRESMALAAAVL
jgi:hypothetical protein